MPSAWSKKELERLRRRFQELNRKAELLKKLEPPKPAVDQASGEAAIAARAASQAHDQAKAGLEKEIASFEADCRKLVDAVEREEGVKLGEPTPVPAGAEAATTAQAAAVAAEAPTPAASKGAVPAAEFLAVADFLSTATTASSRDASDVLGKVAGLYTKLGDRNVKAKLREKVLEFFDLTARRLFREDPKEFEDFLGRAESATSGTDLIDGHPLGRVLRDLEHGKTGVKLADIVQRGQEAEAEAAAAQAQAPAAAAEAAAAGTPEKAVAKAAAAAEEVAKAIEAAGPEAPKDLVGTLLERLTTASKIYASKLISFNWNEKAKEFVARFETRILGANLSVLDRYESTLKLPEKLLQFDRRYKILASIFPEAAESGAGISGEGAALMEGSPLGKFGWVLGADIASRIREGELKGVEGLGEIGELPLVGEAAKAGEEGAGLERGEGAGIGLGIETGLDLGAFGLGGVDLGGANLVAPDAGRIGAPGALGGARAALGAIGAIGGPGAAGGTGGLTPAAMQALAQQVATGKLSETQLEQALGGKATSAQIRAIVASAEGGYAGKPGTAATFAGGGGIGKLDHLALGFQSLAADRRQGRFDEALSRIAGFERPGSGGVGYLAAPSSSYMGAMAPGMTHLELPKMAGPEGYLPMGLKSYYATMPPAEQRALGLAPQAAPPPALRPGGFLPASFKGGVGPEGAGALPTSIPASAISSDAFGIPRFMGGGHLPAAALAGGTPQGLDLSGTLLYGQASAFKAGPAVGFDEFLRPRIGQAPLAGAGAMPGLPPSAAAPFAGLLGMDLPAMQLGGIGLGSSPFLPATVRAGEGFGAHPFADILQRMGPRASMPAGAAFAGAMPALRTPPLDLTFPSLSVASPFDLGAFGGFGGFGPGFAPGPMGFAPPSGPQTAAPAPTGFGMLRPSAQRGGRPAPGGTPTGAKAAFPLPQGFPAGFAGAFPRPAGLEKFYAALGSPGLGLGQLQRFTLPSFGGLGMSPALAMPSLPAMGAPDFAPAGLARLTGPAPMAIPPAGSVTPPSGWSALRAGARRGQGIGYSAPPAMPSFDAAGFAPMAPLGMGLASRMEAMPLLSQHSAQQNLGALRSQYSGMRLHSAAPPLEWPSLFAMPELGGGTMPSAAAPRLEGVYRPPAMPTGPFPSDVLGLAHAPGGFAGAHAPAGMAPRLAMHGMGETMPPAPGEAWLAQLRSHAGAGQPLDAAAIARLRRLGIPGADLARIQTGPAATEATRALGTPGFAAGQQVFLGAGFKPQTAEGWELLAHEISHVGAGQTGAPIHRFVDKLGLPGEGAAKQAGARARASFEAAPRLDEGVVYGFMPRRMRGRFEDRFNLEGFGGSHIAGPAGLGFDIRESRRGLDLALSHEFVRFPGDIGDIPGGIGVPVDLTPGLAPLGDVGATSGPQGRELGLKYGPREHGLPLRGLFWGRPTRRSKIGDRPDVEAREVDLHASLRGYEPRGVAGGLDLETQQGSVPSRYRMSPVAKRGGGAGGRARRLPGGLGIGQHDLLGLSQLPGQVSYGMDDLALAGEFTKSSTRGSVGVRIDTDIAGAPAFERGVAPGGEMSRLPGNLDYMRLTGLDLARMRTIAGANEEAVARLRGEIGARGGVAPGAWALSVESPERAGAGLGGEAVHFRRRMYGGRPTGAAATGSAPGVMAIAAEGSPLRQRARLERGKPLSSPVLSFLERYFARDLSAVQVKEGPAARELNRVAGSDAMAVGTDVLIGTPPATEADRMGLLGHEVSHVVHVRRPVGPSRGTGTPAAPAEQRALRAESDIAALFRKGPGERKLRKSALEFLAISAPSIVTGEEAAAGRSRAPVVQKKERWSNTDMQTTPPRTSDPTPDLGRAHFPRVPQRDMNLLVYQILEKIKRELAIRNERCGGI